MTSAGHSPETRARIARGQRRAVERRRRAAEIGPADLARWRRHGLVSRPFGPIVDAAGIEAGELIEALGGPDLVSPQRKVIIEDVVRIGVALKALLALFVQAEVPDPEIASKLGTLAASRRAGLQACGLERHEREVSLRDYLASRQPDAARAIDPAPGAEVVPADDGPAEGQERDDAAVGAEGVAVVEAERDARIEEAAP